MRYETPQDAHLRLHGTVLRHNGDPVYLAQAGSDQMTFHATLCADPNTVRYINPNDESLDITTPPLGLIEVPLRGGTLALGHVARLPLRGTRQGIDNRNTSTVYLGDAARSIGSSVPGWPRGSSSPNELIAKTILGQYDDFETCRSAMSGRKVLGKAWNRRAGIVKISGVLGCVYDAMLVGLYNPDKNELKLSKQYKIPEIIKEFSKVMVVK